MKPSSKLKRRRFPQLPRQMAEPSKPRLKMTPFFCREKRAARVIQTRRARISPASEPIRVHVSNARSAGDATAAGIAADSADEAGVRTDVPIVRIAAGIAARTGVR